MKRINVVYDGAEYSLADREIDDVRAEIADALASDEPHFLVANFGAGSMRRAELLITRGVAISLMPIDLSGQV